MSDTQDDRDWLTRTVFPEGEEPDPRFTLANERTFLAWTRTALAFLAGGIALEAFDLPELDAQVQTAVALLLIVMGLLISLGAALRWIAVERAMRKKKPLPMPGIVLVLGLAIVLGSVALLWNMLA